MISEMASVRPDLNGFSLYVPGGHEVWLVFHGMRHHVSSPAVYDALFSSAAVRRAAESVDEIRRGPDLNDGTCLARCDDGDSSIYLVTGFPSTDVRRHRIKSWEDFQAFGFDLGLVREIPALILTAVPVGRDLCSSSDDQV